MTRAKRLVLMVVFVSAAFAGWGVPARADERAPWRITAVYLEGLAPDAAKDARGAIIFDDPKTRAVLVLKNGKFEAIPRFLKVHVQFDKDPPRASLDEFRIKDGKGETFGYLHWTSVGKSWVEKGKRVKREGEVILVFERDKYESNPNAFWQSVQGLILQGKDHQETLTGKKAPPPAVTVIGDASTAKATKPGAGPGSAAPVHKNEEMASAALAKAKKFLDDGKTEMGKRYLKNVVTEYSKTKSAQEARKLLDDLEKKSKPK